jgi:hypothetical protein
VNFKYSREKGVEFESSKTRKKCVCFGSVGAKLWLTLLLGREGHYSPLQADGRERGWVTGSLGLRPVVRYMGKDNW